MQARIEIEGSADHHRWALVALARACRSMMSELQQHLELHPQRGLRVTFAVAEDGHVACADLERPGELWNCSGDEGDCPFGDCPFGRPVVCAEGDCPPASLCCKGTEHVWAIGSTPPTLPLPAEKCAAFTDTCPYVSTCPADCDWKGGF